MRVEIILSSLSTKPFFVVCMIFQCNFSSKIVCPSGDGIRLELEQKCYNVTFLFKIYSRALSFVVEQIYVSKNSSLDYPQMAGVRGKKLSEK